MKCWLFISLAINMIMAGAAWWSLHRLGGWRFALHRLQHEESALYTHRRELFGLLPGQTGSIVFLGDSQTALCEWRELLGDSLPILNRGIVGDQVNGVSARLEEVVRHQPAKIFLLIGINDLLWGKSVEETGAGYQELVHQIRSKAPAARLILQSVLPVNNRVKNTGLDNAAIRALNAQLAEIARTENLPFMDIYAALADMNGHLDPRYTQDGVHLNGEGYRVWKQQLDLFLSSNRE